MWEPMRYAGSMMAQQYFDDLTVGQVFTSGTATVARDRIVEFAAEFDPQPQHLSEETARDSLFGELVASGWHTGSLTMRLQLEALLGHFPGGAMGAQVDSMAWLKPVRPGDALRATVEVMAKRPSRSRPDRGILTLKTTTLNQHNEAVMVMTAAVLAPLRPA